VLWRAACARGAQEDQFLLMNSNNRPCLIVKMLGTILRQSAPPTARAATVTRPVARARHHSTARARARAEESDGTAE
jgi:hypothetical protein